MKVRAIKDVFYDNRRWKKGSVFELREIKGKKQDYETRKLVDHIFTVDEQFSAESMEPIDPAVQIGKPKIEPKVRKPKTLAQAAKTDRVVVSDLEVI